MFATIMEKHMKVKVRKKKEEAAYWNCRYCTERNGIRLVKISKTYKLKLTCFWCHQMNDVIVEGSK